MVGVAGFRDGCRVYFQRKTPDLAAAESLFATPYGELHRLARREVARRAGYITLGATTLLHEAYLGMSARAGMVFPDHARFIAYAVRAMRGLIIDYVRRRYAQKRGGSFELTSLQTTVADRVTNANELERISDALDELAGVEPALAEVVDLKFFCGFSLRSRRCGGYPSGPSSATGKRRACTCTTRSATRRTLTPQVAGGDGAQG